MNKNESKIDFSFFDTVHNRKNTNSVKFDIPDSAKYGKDIIPMWIADMDFKVPPMVEQKLTETAKHGIFGYTNPGSGYFDALTKWYSRRMNWEIKPSATIQTPGVMFGVSAAINALTLPNDSILIFQPVYYPFQKIITDNNRKCVVSVLELKNNSYCINFEETEKAIAENNVKMLLFCSPHNPVGRVWKKEELQKLAEICLRHNVLIVSDEIHSDFVYGSNRHIPMETLSEEIAARTITCTAPSKTFNLAELQAANLVITNPALREKVQAVCTARGYHRLNTMAAVAAETAYRYGEQWLDTLLLYLENNIRLVQESLQSINSISLIPPEGTYLLWLDCRRLGLADEQLKSFFADEAGIGIHNGSTFGMGGSGFVRMNIACPQSVLQEAMSRLIKAAKSL